LEEMPRLKCLPQFVQLEIPPVEDLTVLVQGFGAVGANTARLISERLEGAKVIGISDALGYLYDGQGLPIEELFHLRQEMVSVTRPYFSEKLVSDRWGVSRIKYCSAANDLLRESAFCLIPASPVSNYLDLDEHSQPSVTVDKMGKWTLIVEGANTYSPDHTRRADRKRMEREVFRQRGVLIATDYLVNSGAVIFAAQELLIKTPGHLRIPNEILGDREKVDEWLRTHAKDLEGLATERRKAAEAARERVIRRNMQELVDMLISDPDLLPCEVAESISIQRVATRESDRTASEIMVPMPTINEGRTIRDAAAMLVDTNCSILAVVSEENELVGVVTDWDVTRSTAEGISKKQPLSEIVQRDVISVGPKANILGIIRKLEHQEISSMPVVENGHVLGMVSTDLLARRTLYRLLQSNIGS
jgi:CBS domain-containing protein